MSYSLRTFTDDFLGERVVIDVDLSPDQVCRSHFADIEDDSLPAVRELEKIPGIVCAWARQYGKDQAIVHVRLTPGFNGEKYPEFKSISVYTYELKVSVVRVEFAADVRRAILEAR